MNGTIEYRPATDADVRAQVLESWAAHLPAMSAFHEAFYRAPHTWPTTRWRGVPVLKNPCDLWVLQEVLASTRPEVIIECGSGYGGSALWLMDIAETHGFPCSILSVDITDYGRARPQHPRITWLLADSVSDEMRERVAALTAGAARVMVLLDSDHTEARVLAELDAYAAYVTPGCFLVVEDTNITGARHALERWLPQHQEFAHEICAEHYLLTFNPGGWLRRRA